MWLDIIQENHRQIQGAYVTEKIRPEKVTELKHKEMNTILYHLLHRIVIPEWKLYQRNNISDCLVELYPVATGRSKDVP